MWTLEHFDMEYEVVSADDYDKLDALYDTIVLAPGITRARIVDGLDMTRYPQEFAWARGVGDDGLVPARRVRARAAARCSASAPRPRPRSSCSTCRSRAWRPMQPFSHRRLAAARDLRHRSQPAAWGLPSDWVTYFNGDRAFNVSGNAKVVGAYPGHRQHARVRLRGRRRAAARQGRHRLDGRRAGLGHGRRLAVDVPLVAALAVAAGLQLRLPRAVEGGHGAGAQGRRGRRVGRGEPGRRGARDAGDARGARRRLRAGRQGRGGAGRRDDRAGAEHRRAWPRPRPRR